jgi:hypothetical protein
MLRIIVFALLALVVGYGIGLFGGMWLVNTFSNNPRDRELEAAMTAAFVIGPVVAVLTAVATVVFIILRDRG